MTAARQQRKSPITLGLALGIGIFAGIFASPAILAAPSDRIVVDAHTGLAISGFDPVAYFTDAKPKVGRPDMELRFDGTVWRFRNEGNRASFKAHPEIYAPQFGGYDPVDLARGITVAGNPRFWVIAGQRLYLFGFEEHRDAFAANPQPSLREANARWYVLEQELAQ